MAKKKSARSYNLIVIRIGHNNALRMSKPCKNCLTVLKSYRLLNKIYYVDSDGNIISESVQEMETNYISTGFRKRGKKSKCPYH